MGLLATVEETIVAAAVAVAKFPAVASLTAVAGVLFPFL